MKRVSIVLVLFTLLISTFAVAAAQGLPPSASASFNAPTQTPTFNPASIRTATPAPAAQCPPKFTGAAPTPEFVHPFRDDYPIVKEQDILDYLNRYGADAFYQAYQNAGGKNWFSKIQAYRDLTNDGIPELVFESTAFYILGCKNGRYVTLYKRNADGWMMIPVKIIHSIDGNRNGIPEISLLDGYMSQGGHYYRVMEWDGAEFQDLLKPHEVWDHRGVFVEANGYFSYGDFDHDGMIEYSATIGDTGWLTDSLGIPWRQETQIYKWDGKSFSYHKSLFSPPEYRFQAVQDGDRASLEGSFDQALNAYRQVIYNHQLKPWSAEWNEYLLGIYYRKYSKAPTPPPPPIPPQPDLKEYDSLAAYSRYRIMLLYLSNGWQSDAKLMYDSLQKRYPSGKPEHIYAQLAEQVWAEFSKSNDLRKACQKAVGFAAQNKDTVYYYIGGSGFGERGGLIYEENPKLICPFQ